ncbi:cytosolic sulfotransferase 15-like [Iris pallida]|uniref:Sulfotransferase n=1 Tax=Iris pallida TaxID=29817 RepID=A0AAX6F075_IRIPA|nr:cytosolic sulfotransferase 15-like [Iris pallida]
MSYKFVALSLPSSTSCKKPSTYTSMEQSPASRQTEQEHEEEVYQRVHQQCRDLVSSLPIVEGCSYPDLCFHDGFFRPMPPMVAAMMVRKLFEARPNDIILATLPKSGTTWLKALLFATVNRNSSPSSTGNLATSTPTSVFLSLKSSCMETVQESRTWTRYPPRGFWPHISRSISYPPLSTPDVGSSTYAAIPRITSCPFGTLSIKSGRTMVRASASRGRLRPLLPRAFPWGTFLGSHVRLLEGKPPSRGMQCPVHEVRGVDEISYGGAEGLRSSWGAPSRRRSRRTGC